MKKELGKYLLLAAMLLMPCLLNGQGQVYTRKAKLEDFSTRTTKIVLTGLPMFDIILKEEVSSRWRISPYEFCSVSEYERFKNRSLYYFMRFAKDDDFMYLIVSKGGLENGEDPMKLAFDVIKMPIAAADNPSGQELIYMSAFIDIVQDFLVRAIESDRVAYGGLKSISRKRSTRGKLIYLGEERSTKAFEVAEEDALCGVLLQPADTGRQTYCYKMLIGADDHMLYYWRKQRIFSSNDRNWTATDKINFKGKIFKEKQ